MPTQPPRQGKSGHRTGAKGIFAKWRRPSTPDGRKLARVFLCPIYHNMRNTLVSVSIMTVFSIIPVCFGNKTWPFPGKDDTSMLVKGDLLLYKRSPFTAYPSQAKWQILPYILISQHIIQNKNSCKICSFDTFAWFSSYSQGTKTCRVFLFCTMSEETFRTINRIWQTGTAGAAYMADSLTSGDNIRHMTEKKSCKYILFWNIFCNFAPN